MRESAYRGMSSCSARSAVQVAITTLRDPIPLFITVRAEVLADERGRLCLSIDGRVMVR